MSTGNASSLNPKPVPAWLNSAAWTSKPRSPMRSSCSFGERSGSGTVLEAIDKPPGDYEDPLSSIAKVQKEAVMPQDETDVIGLAALPAQNADFLEHSSDTDENNLVVKSPASFNYRVSLFNTELSRRIHLAELRRLSLQGIPYILEAFEQLLGRNRDDWAMEVKKKRVTYAVFRDEMIINPSEITRRKEEMEAMKVAELEALEGPLQRHEISHDDHPLSLGSKSIWHQFFQDTELAEQINRDVKRTHPDMQFVCGDNNFARENQEALKRILFIFAKLNPGIRYVQGMNEVLAPLYYVFKTDVDEVNVFSNGIRKLIKVFLYNLDEHLRHLVNPQFYAFRWITLLLTQEFIFTDSLRLWDSLLSNPDGPLEILLRVCCSMLLCLRSRLLAGDFTTNLKLLQQYPSVDISHLLRVADDLKD